MTDAIVCPDVDTIHAIHADIVAEDDETDPGIRMPGQVSSALTYITQGYFGEVPETIHEKAAHLMRLLAAGHPYIDGNKRTALNSTELLYDLNGYDFDYDDVIRGILQVFAINAEAVDMDAVTTYCRSHTISPTDTYS